MKDFVRDIFFLPKARSPQKFASKLFAESEAFNMKKIPLNKFCKDMLFVYAISMRVINLIKVLKMRAL